MNSELRICFFGDSLVHGTGDPLGLGWVGRVARRAREAGHVLTAYNMGVRRNTTSDVHERWRDEAMRRLPAAYNRRLVFSCGVNDMVIEEGRTRLAPEKSVQHLREILKPAAGLMPTLMIGPPPVHDAAHNLRLAPLNALFAAVAAELEVPFFDSFEPLRASPVWMRELAAGDGLHPGDAGYSLWANLIADWDGWWLREQPAKN